MKSGPSPMRLIRVCGASKQRRSKTTRTQARGGRDRAREYLRGNTSGSAAREAMQTTNLTAYARAQPSSVILLPSLSCRAACSRVGVALFSTHHSSHFIHTSIHGARIITITTAAVSSSADRCRINGVTNPKPPSQSVASYTDYVIRVRYQPNA